MTGRRAVDAEVVDDGQHTDDAGPSYGAPAALWRTLERARPPLPVFTSPVRGPWLTSVLAAVLLVGLPVLLVTGLLSYAAYEPRLGGALPADPGVLRLPHFAWPTGPSWLYRVNQGLHVGLGLALVPVVLAKLWSVLPKLFAWPPARSLAQVLERLSLLLLVGSILFELVTGVLNIQYWYVFGFDFYTAHYYGAWVFLGAFALHVFLKLPTMVRSLRSRSLREELRTPLARTVAEPPDLHGLVSPTPGEPTISRRGVLALVGGASALLTLVTLGETVGIRATALLSPRGRSYGDGPNDFQVNRTARAAQVVAAGDDWRLVLRGGPREVSLSRAELLAMPQHTAELPIACVEGWSTVQTWTGVRLRDLAALAGVPEPSRGTVRSLEQAGAFAQAVLSGGQLGAGDALLALRVNGVDLSLDHGYPARTIVPAAPGVHNTKWVREIELLA
ncbi:MAG TPA: molybdopterin-dependent oxidoreductase [Mycobacteriales bacterium]|jgi:DMSO/TMAO reductase YedYZ molybdopterin-dependent catalytic subunit|nr:molybdopterin-dependent oxidoreductase [Mycobacteriales bacterium]